MRTTVPAIIVLLALCETAMSADTKPAQSFREPVKIVDSGWKASWSPDGKRLVFGKPRGTGLGILTLETGKTTVLVAEGKDAAWSPDGRFIAYVRERQFNDHTEEVWLVDPKGGNPQRLIRGGFPSWSDDGKTVFVHTRLVPGKILGISVDDADAEPLVMMDPAPAWYPTMSSNGKAIAFGSNASLLVLDPRTRAVLLGFPVPGTRGLLLGWSADSSMLAFGGFDSDEGGLWVLDVKARKYALLVEGPFTMPAWSQDGTKIAFDRRCKDGYQVWAAGQDWVRMQLEKKGKPIPAGRTE